MPKLIFWEKNKKNILECYLLNFLPRVLECMVKKVTGEKICDLSLFCTIEKTFDHSLIIDLWYETYENTRAGVCKTLCPQLPDSNTVWLQHCLAMTVTTVQIYDFNVILSKGNNSKIGDDWDKKEIRITYFFMRNQNMKFQNISIHGSKLMLYTIKQRH